MESHPENTASPTAPSATGVECQREAVPEADEQEPPTKRAAVEASSAAFIVGEPVSYAKESVEQKSNVVASVTQTQQQDLVPSVVRQIVAQQQVPFVPAVVSKPVWVKLTGEAGKMRGCRFLNDPEVGHMYMQATPFVFIEYGVTVEMLRAKKNVKNEHLRAYINSLALY